MKKLHLILCAGILALAAVSCKKDAQPVEPAKPMSATEIKQKLANTAVDALNEVDPDNWTGWAQTGMKLVNSLQQVEGGNIQEISDDLRDAMRSIEDKDNITTTIYLLKLSLVKGDITVEDNAFKYTESNNPLNITYVMDGKTYKAQLESEGDNGEGLILFQSEDDSDGRKYVNIEKVFVPTKAAIHVTENGKLFLDVVINPTVEDKDKNGILDENDVIKGTATIQIPGYSLALNDLLVSDKEVKAAVSLSHADKNVLTVDAQANMDLFIERVKALENPRQLHALCVRAKQDDLAEKLVVPEYLAGGGNGHNGNRNVVQRVLIRWVERLRDLQHVFIDALSDSSRKEDGKPDGSHADRYGNQLQPQTRLHKVDQHEKQEQQTQLNIGIRRQQPVFVVFHLSTTLIN